MAHLGGLRISVSTFRWTLMIGCLLIGLGAGTAADAGLVVNSGAYRYGVEALLAIGLYSSVSAIDLHHLRHDLRTVAFAVTVGVLLKAVLIALVMGLAFQRPAYIVFGIAVAQIDPLSVAALGGGKRLSERGRALLYAWASFDDPMTMLLTVYAALAIPSGLGVRATAFGGLAQLAGDLVANLALAALGFALWLTIQLLKRRFPTGRMRAAIRIVACVVLVLLGVLAVANFLMLGLAVLGLFFRPHISRQLDALARGSFAVATVALGMIMTMGVDPVPGLTLGAAAFGTQMLVSRLVTRSLGRSDRIYLALAQQNGITAIILALLLERDLPGAVGVVAPAIIVISVLHAVTNAAYDRLSRPSRFPGVSDLSGSRLSDRQLARPVGELPGARRPAPSADVMR